MASIRIVKCTMLMGIAKVVRKSLSCKIFYVFDLLYVSCFLNKQWWYDIEDNNIIILMHLVYLCDLNINKGYHYVV